MNRIALRIALFACSLVLGSAGSAHAEPGSICKNYFGTDVGVINYLPTATFSASSTPTTVLCPAGVIPNAEQAFVDVGLLHNGPQNTRCSAYTFDPQGRLLSSGTHAASFAGFAVLSPQIRTRIQGSVGVLCTIPGATNGLITDVSVRKIGA